MDGSLRGRHCCTAFCCNALSGCVDRFVAVVVRSCRVSTASWDIFSIFLFSPGIAAANQAHTCVARVMWCWVWKVEEVSPYVSMRIVGTGGPMEDLGLTKSVKK